ncbi:MAG: XTP/dITP diphosphatase [Anaerolineales bacterium]
MFPTPKVLLATTNKGKIKEFLGLLSQLNITILTPKDLELDLEVDETGVTYAENAILKAKAYQQLAKMPVLADDSGLEVDALQGAPGVWSARYAPQPGATDADRRKYLLEQLRPYPQPWTARFRCVVALANHQGALHLVEGICEGQIISEERGQGGFGYDPVFLVEGGAKTMAELDFEEKNQRSHRARAVHAAIPILEVIARSGE